MSWAGATWALAAREWVRLSRQPARIAATVGTPIVLLAALGSGFAGSMTGLMGVGDGRAYAAFLLPGMMAMSALFASVFGAIALIEDRESGFLLALMAGPAPGGSVVAAKALGVGLPAALQALVLLPAAWALGLSPGLGQVALAALGAALMTAGVVGFSLALAWRSRGTQEFHGVMNTVLMPMWLVSGAFYPAAESATFMRWLTAANPMAWAVESVRAALAGEPSALLAGWALPLTAAFALGGLGLALRTIRLRRPSR